MRSPLTAAAVAALLTLAGCSAAEDAARDVGGRATEEAKQAAVDVAKRELCSAAKEIVADGRVSESEKARATVALDAAEAAGVPDEVTAPVRTAVAEGSELPADASSTIDERCAA